MSDLQPTLFDHEAGAMPYLSPTIQPKGDFTSLEDRFWEFHRLNPHVYHALVNLARAVKAAGRTRFGIGALFERLRFEAVLQTWGDEYRLNNNHRAFYARLIMAQEPDLEGFFEVREQRRQFSLEN